MDLRNQLPKLPNPWYWACDWGVWFAHNQELSLVVYPAYEAGEAWNPLTDQKFQVPSSINTLVKRANER